MNDATAQPEPTTVVDAVVDTDAEIAPPRTYQERKEQGWCTYGACRRRASDDHQMCPRHRSRANARNRRWTQGVRDDLAGQGKCRRCRKPSSTVRCPACKILDGANLPTTVVDAVVDTDAFRRDSDGWERYRGKGRRGPPPQVRGDTDDLDAAFKELERGRQALIYAHSLVVKQLGRQQQRAAKQAAAAVLALAAGFIGEVVARNDPERAGALAELEREVAEHDRATGER